MAPGCKQVRGFKYDNWHISSFLTFALWCVCFVTKYVSIPILGFVYSLYSVHMGNLAEILDNQSIIYRTITQVYASVIVLMTTHFVQLN